MEWLQTLLSMLANFLPAQAVPLLSDGGTVAILFLLVVAVLALLQKVVTDILTEKLKEYLRLVIKKLEESLEQGPWLVLLLLYMLPVLFLLMARRFWTALLMGLCGTVVWIVQRWSHRHLLSRWTVAAQIVVCLIALLGEGWYLNWRKQIRDAQVQAYFVLPFKKHTREEYKHLEWFWEVYYKTLSHAFAEVQSVKVHVLPKKKPNQDEFQSLSRSIEELRDRLQREAYTPDVVLDNNANVIAYDNTEPHSVVLLTIVKRLQGKTQDCRTEARYIKMEGAGNDVKYLALQMTLEFLKYLRDCHDLRFPQKDEVKIMKRLLGDYKVFLLLKGSTNKVDQSVLDTLEKALKADIVQAEEVQGLLVAYTSPVDRAMYASKVAAVREANLKKIEAINE